MKMNEVDDTACFRLAHYAGQTVSSTSRTTRYVLSRLDGIQRPESGVADAVVSCEKCGTWVRVTVESESAVLQQRRETETKGRVSGALMVALIVLAFVGGAQHDGGLAAFCAVLAFIAFCFWLELRARAKTRQGVKVANDESSQARAAHKIMELDPKKSGSGGWKVAH
jgi:hypothetical protein